MVSIDVTDSLTEYAEIRGWKARRDLLNMWKEVTRRGLHKPEGNRSWYNHTSSAEGLKVEFKEGDIRPSLDDHFPCSRKLVFVFVFVFRRIGE